MMVIHVFGTMRFGWCSPLNQKDCDMPNVSLDTTDAAELGELLQFISDWLAADHGPLGASLTRFIGNRGYNLAELRADIDRFTFLLGGNDGESLFQLGQP
jgi:hypothetical protein